MISFFKGANQVFAVATKEIISQENCEKLIWLFGDAQQINSETVNGTFTGPRKEMITPWSTNAVEITQNMGIEGIDRIEEYFAFEEKTGFDPMLQVKYKELHQAIFTVDTKPEEIIHIEDIASYNEKEGLALSQDEVDYLNSVSKDIGRKLTDSEVFGFSQINSEHCRHKIFNGTFIIDGEKKETSLFKLIKKTSEMNGGNLVSAYKDNVAFVKGPQIELFAPKRQDIADYYHTKEIQSVLSLKAETHNFPTTVEPFNGAATGSGGEIRDRLAGGKGSLPLAGTAVYMTSYSRLEDERNWEAGMEERPWLYQTPMDILIKASNGASDFGNKFGQPLISGSVLTFEHEENNKQLGFDKVIMLAGGIGWGKHEDALKDVPNKGDRVVILGGDTNNLSKKSKRKKDLSLKSFEDAKKSLEKTLANINLDKYKNLLAESTYDIDVTYTATALLGDTKFELFLLNRDKKDRVMVKKYQNEAIEHYTKAISIAPDQAEIEKIELDQDVDLISPADLYMARGNVYSWMNNKRKNVCNDWKVSKKLGNEDAQANFRDWRC